MKSTSEGIRDGNFTAALFYYYAVTALDFLLASGDAENIAGT